MQAGDTIARRFYLVRVEETDLPGVTRFVATDARLDAEVTVDLVTSIAPTSVVKAAQRARVIRDRRLARVLAAGFERHGDDRIAYIVRERPVGLSLADVLGTYQVALPEASAIFGEAAAGLAVAATAGEHHGLLRASSITLTPAGKLLISGLAIDGELASQAGRGKGRTERADAIALAGLFLSAITGLPVGEATRADLPEGLAAPVRKLCEAAIKGSGPKTFADITAALGKASPRVLRRLAAESPELWWPVAPVVVAEPEVVVEAPVVEAPVVEAPVVEAPPAEGPEVEAEVVTDDEPAAGTDVLAPEPDVVDATIEDEAPSTEVAAPDIIEAEIAEELPYLRPRTRFGGAVDDIDEFHDIVAAQAPASHQPAVLEVVLEALSTRFPASQRLATAAAAAKERAALAPPINAAPLVVVLLLTAVFVAGVIAIGRITAPIDNPDDGGYQYPTYTFGVSTPPSASPSAPAAP